MPYKFNPFTGNFDEVIDPVSGGGTSNHSALLNLEWSNAGHTIDEAVVMNDNCLSAVKCIDFTNEPINVSDVEGVVAWNSTNKTLDIHTGLGPVLQVGQEHQAIVYNGTQEIIPNGTVIYPIGVISGEFGIAPAMAPAKSDTFENFSIGVGVATMDIPLSGDGIGISTDLGNIRNFDTTIYEPFSTLWLSPSGGLPTDERPEFPNYAVQIGASGPQSPSGAIGLAIKAEPTDTYFNAWNGAFRESIDFRITSDGTNVSGILTPSNGNVDMTMMFSDGFSMLDTSPSSDILLTAGTDTNPQRNFVYITKENKVLEVSTSSWPAPSVEHIKVADIILQSALKTQTDDALKNQNWNDHVRGVNGNGHIGHMAEAIRRKIPATWLNGTAGTCTVSGTPSDVFVAVTGGNVMQMHEQEFEALDSSTGDDLHIVNHFTTPYVTTENLNTQTVDALGVSLANSSFSFVLWGVQNKTGETSHMMINLPVGKYLKNLPENAVQDADNYSVYDIPDEFGGTAFLIARFTFVLEAGGTAWSLYDTEDLRGKIPNLTVGGGGGGTGVTDFTQLSDTPSTYTGMGEYFVKVNAAENALEFVEKDTTDIDYLSGQIDTNTTNIDYLSGQIDTNTTNIDYLSGQIDINTSNIDDLSGMISVLETDTTVNFLTGDTITEKQAKIDALPRQSITSGDVSVIFQFEDGAHTHTDTLYFRGFQYPIIVQGNSGDTGALSTAQSVQIDTSSVDEDCLMFENCTGDINVAKLKITVDSVGNNRCVYVLSCPAFSKVNACYFLGNGTASGTLLKNSQSGLMRIDRIYFSNSKYGVQIDTANAYSNGNASTGTIPLYGMWAFLTATIGKNGTQPTGSIEDELTSLGGIIRTSDAEFADVKINSTAFSGSEVLNVGGESNLDGIRVFNGAGENVNIGHGSVGATGLGYQNIAIGSGPLASITLGGNYNIAMGTSAGSGLTGSGNIAIGKTALGAATTIANSVVIGNIAADVLTDNPASIVVIGDSAMGSATTSAGDYAIAIGNLAMNTGGGVDDIAIGRRAGYDLTTGSIGNVLVGPYAGTDLTTGDYNVAIGYFPLQLGITPTNNIALGFYSLRNSSAIGNIGIGFLAGDLITTGTYNTLVGYDADVAANSDSNSIVIGYQAIGKGANTVVIGNSSITKNYLTGSLLVDKATLESSETLSVGGDAYIDGDIIQNPSASITPSNNGELVVEATSNTTLTFKLKGTDGTVRTGTITLS